MNSIPDPVIKTIPGKKFIGKRMIMSFTENKTHELWHSFMPRCKEIRNPVGTTLYSIEVYPPFFFKDFNPETAFEKWAAVEVSETNKIPPEMETITSPAGLYAAFIHRGPASNGPVTYRHIFNTWLPGSGYEIDLRPHFAVMDEKYKTDSDDSEEELWIPVKPS